MFADERYTAGTPPHYSYDSFSPYLLSSDNNGTLYTPDEPAFICNNFLIQIIGALNETFELKSKLC